MRRVSFDTAFGHCAVSWHDAGLTGFELPEAPLRSSDDSDPPPEIARLIARVQRHLRGEAEDFSDLAYDFAALPVFNAEVLKATLAIKPGNTSTYGQIAATLGYPPAVSRAVGVALGANRWPLLIPCHRVLGADGRMMGFSGPGGVRLKSRLLALEGAQLISE